MADSIGTIWVKIGAKIDGLEKAMSDVEKATVKIGKNLQKVGKDMTVAGGAVTAALGLMIKKTADFGDALWDMKQQTGISTEVLSSFKLAADKSGTSLEGVAVGLRFLGRNMAEAAQGTKESAEAFARLGISVKNASGGLRPMDDVLLEVAEKFAQMEDGAAKSSLAIQLFGRSGTALIPMLNLGKAGIAELREEAHRLGIVISDETAQKADQFNDTMTSLKASLQGAGMTIANSVMPAVKGVAEIITSVVAGVNKWASSNGTLVQTLTGLTGAVAAGLTVVGSFLLVLGSIMTKLPLIAAALGTTTVALVASTAAWTAAAAALGYYLIKLREKAEWEGKAEQATDAYWKKYEEFRAKLLEVAKAAGLNVYQFNQLTAKYGENVVALAAAIQKGEEGKALQDALVKVGKEHAAAIDEQKKAALALSPALDVLNGNVGALAESTKTGAESFTEMTRSIWDLRKAAAMPLPQIEILNTLPDVKDRYNDIYDAQLKWLGLSKKSITEVKSYWDQFADGLQSKWGSAIGNVLSHATSLKEGLKGIFQAIKQQFFDMIGQMIAKFLVGFVMQVLSGMNIIKAATSAWSSLGSAAAGAASAVGGAGTAAAGAAVTAGAAIGSAFTAAFLGVWAVGFAAAIKGVFNWNKKKSPEQFQAELAWIDQLKAQWVAQGLSDEQIKNKLANLNWWMSSPGSRGGAGATGNRWASGFSGIITQPTTATFGESGAERVSVTPVGAGATMPGGSGGVTLNLYAPMVSTTGISKTDAMTAADILFQAVQSAARRRGISLA